MYNGLWQVLFLLKISKYLIQQFTYYNFMNDYGFIYNSKNNSPSIYKNASKSSDSKGYMITQFVNNRRFNPGFNF